MDASNDYMHKQTDKEIERIRKRLAAEYKQAGEEMKKKAELYFAKFVDVDNKKRALVEAGDLSWEEYIAWRTKKVRNEILNRKRIDVLAQYLVNADKQARDIVRNRAFGVYADHYNWGKFEVETGFGINTGFTLFNEKTVERLVRKNPKLLPDPSEKTKKKIREGKIKKWSSRKINNAIIQGVLQGEAIDKIADRLDVAVRMGWNNAVRNARTAMTGAQNAGRLDSYKDSQKLGIKMNKGWMATLDERTRESHQELDGEIVPIDKPFSNGLMCPGDPEGDPEEVYNCRCTMFADLVDYPSKFERYVNGKSVGNMTYKEWAAAKKGN